MLIRLPRKSTVYALGLTGLLVAHPSSAAPTKRPVAKQATPTVKKPNPTDVLATHLALNSLVPGENIAEACRRAEFKHLAIALSMNSNLLHQEKGEYETTDQFAERVSKLWSAVNGGETIFCQPLDDNEDLPFVYNADSQKFEASFDRNQNVWRDVKQLGSYRSKTRMGAAATVKASSQIEYDASLTMPRSDDSCGATSSYSSIYKFQVPAAVSEAPMLKARGYVAFIGKLVSPYVTEEESSGSPTLDDPFDIQKVNLTVNLKPTRIVLINGGGKELWSCKPGFQPPNMAPVPKGDPGGWVSSYDRPASALNEQRSGVVKFSLKIDKTGAVTDCAVTASSGFADLDDQTCSTLRRRARFTPATDENANPTKGVWSSTVRWNN